MVQQRRRAGRLNAGVSRRRFLRNTALASGGLAGAALIGCGEDTDTPTATATPGAGTPAAATGTPTSTTGQPDGSPVYGGVYRDSITGDPPSIHPYRNHSFATKGFAAHVYSRLYRIGAEPDLLPADALPVPDLAESAETADGQSWVVTLKQGVKFQDLAPVSGREVTAEDVKFSWTELEGSGLGVEIEHVLNVEVVDEYTVRFDLAAPSPVFLELIADGNFLWIMPTESAGGFDAAINPIGSGPFIMEDYQASQAFRFARNPDYFEEGLPYVDGVEQAIIPEYANQVAQFEAGNLHVLGVAADDVLGLRSRRSELQWSGLVPIGLHVIYFSGPEQDPEGAWRDERFRQGVSLALDRSGQMELGYNITALKDGGLDVAESWNNIVAVGYGSRWWLDPQSTDAGETGALFQHDPTEARRLFEAAGAIDGPPVKFAWAVNRYGTTFERMSEALAGMIADTGLQLETETQDYNSVYITQTVRGNFNGMALGPMTPYPEVGAHLQKMFIRQPYSLGGLEDPAIVELTEESMIEMDATTRSEQVMEIQRMNAAQMHYVPTAGGSGYTWTAFQPQIRGIRRTRGYGGPTESLARYWIAS